MILYVCNYDYVYGLVSIGIATQIQCILAMLCMFHGVFNLLLNTGSIPNRTSTKTNGKIVPQNMKTAGRHAIPFLVV